MMIMTDLKTYTRKYKMKHTNGYKLFRKTQIDTKYMLLNYCFSRECAKKLISLYKRRKILILNEKPELNTTAKWKVIPITRYEAMMAEKDVPF